MPYVQTEHISEDTFTSGSVRLLVRRNRNNNGILRVELNIGNQSVNLEPGELQHLTDVLEKFNRPVIKEA